MHPGLTGDAGCSDPALYEEYTGVFEANLMAAALAAEVGMDATFIVKNGRKTRIRYGTLTKIGNKKFLMRLNSCGHNMGTVIHEMAHVSMSGKLISGHPDAFRRQLLILTVAYRGLKSHTEVIEKELGRGHQFSQKIG
jgi:hypothetical protein